MSRVFFFFARPEKEEAATAVAPKVETTQIISALLAISGGGGTRHATVSCRRANSIDRATGAANAGGQPPAPPIQPPPIQPPPRTGSSWFVDPPQRPRAHTCAECTVIRRAGATTCHCTLLRRFRRRFRPTRAADGTGASQFRRRLQRSGHLPSGRQAPPPPQIKNERRRCS